MNKAGKIVIVIVLIVAVAVVIILKQEKSSSSVVENSTRNIQDTAQAKKTEAQSAAVEQSKALPRLVDLGADKCIPCKMMAPILEELKSEYEGTLIIEFIDVWKNPDEAPKYGIKLIPTQIFFDASGKEHFRHEGFMSKEDILAKWNELGVELIKTK